MAHQLRDGLREAASEAGCSLNAFAVQALAAAAGDLARFRLPTAGPPTIHELERDARGYPIDWKERQEHMGARSDFIGAMDCEMPSDEVVALIKRLDRENPAHFVEWSRSRAATRPAGR